VIFGGGPAGASAHIEYQGFSEMHEIDVSKWTGTPGVVEEPQLLPLPPCIERFARMIFTTDRATTKWLNSPAPALDGCKPIEKLKTAAGVMEVESMLVEEYHKQSREQMSRAAEAGRGWEQMLKIVSLLGIDVSSGFSRPKVVFGGIAKKPGKAKP